MIVTLTLNPSVDRTVAIESLARGEVMRALSVRVDPGGKGINVSRALAANGIATQAIVTLGGAEGEHLLALLRGTGVEIVPVRISGAIRSNITVVEPDGTTTKFNEPGARLDIGELTAVFDAVRRAADGADWLIASGSLPPDMSVEVYADLIRALDGTGTRIAIDTSGPALATAIAACPDLVKPNRDELAAVTGRMLQTIADVVEAAVMLRRQGARTVLASIGADGAVLVDDDGAIHGRTPAVAPLSSVGTGDAMLAGFIAGGGRGERALVEALAWGAAAVRLPGSGMPTPADIDRSAVRLERGAAGLKDQLAMPP